MVRPAVRHRRLSSEALELVAVRFRVLGDKTRLELICQLQEGEKNVSELVSLTQGTQANISRHLQTLTEAGILRRRKEGLHMYYSLADGSIFELCDQVCRSLKKHLANQSRALG